jgi:hypothetical protein
MSEAAPYTAEDRRYDDKSARMASTSLGLGAGACVLWLILGLLTMITGAAAVIYGALTLQRVRLGPRQRKQAWWGIALGIAGNVALLVFTFLVMNY